MPKAVFKISRLDNLFNGVIGMGAMLLSLWHAHWVTHSTEADLMDVNSRMAVYIKLIEQLIGWDYFVISVLIIAVIGMIFGIIYTAGSFWRVVNSTPDIAVFDDYLEFHPAVRLSPARLSEVSHWSIETDKNLQKMRIYFFKSFWSMENIFAGNSIEIEGSEAAISEIKNFFNLNERLSKLFINHINEIIYEN